MASEAKAAPSLFLRNATGLVKGWSGFDAFAYSFMSVNLVCLGMFYSLAIFAYVPDGSAIASMPGSNSQSRVRLAAIGPVTRASRRPTIKPRSRSSSKKNAWSLMRRFFSSTNAAASPVSSAKRLVTRRRADCVSRAPACSALFEHCHRRQRFALQKFEERTARGRYVADSVGDAKFVDR